MKRRTLVVLVEDIPGVLDRVASLFRRRGYNIESLTVGHTDRPGVSHITVTMNADDRVASLVAANLYHWTFGRQAGYLWPHLYSTLVSTLLGLFVAVTSGFFVGLLLSQKRRLAAIFNPFIDRKSVV